MDVNELIKRDGLDLQKLENFSNKNKVLFSIRKQLRDLNMVDEDNTVRLAKSYSERFFDEGKQQKGQKNTKKTYLMQRLLL